MTAPRTVQVGHKQPETDHQGAIALSLRIGITGHRDITDDHPGLTTEIANAVEYIIERLATDPDRIRSGEIALTAVSSLAEGADRLVAREILKRPGSRLEIVLPLPPEDYCQDFSSATSVEEFDEFRKRHGATTDTVPPARSRDQAYELAGHAVVDRSDVMIVVWDGHPARGRGGTAEIYAYARRWQIPILLISIDHHSAELDTDHLPRAAKGTTPLSRESMKSLQQYNREDLPESAVAALPPLLAETDSSHPLSSTTRLAEHIFPYYARADLIAQRFQRRWFLAIRLLYTLAPLAVLVVAAQATFAPARFEIAWFEFAILIVIIAVLVTVRMARWHRRWVSARYLAEQIRSLMFLGLTGIVTLEKPAAADRRAVDESGWTERAANEIWFTRPRYRPPADISPLIKVLYEQWIKKQREYHSGVSRTYRALSTRFHIAAVILFSLSALFALLHSLGAGGTSSRPFKWWDFLAIAIPGMAAALGGYGAQRDYVRHGERSMLFAATLESASDRLLTAASLPEVQQAALGVSRAMRSEATDWYTVVHSQDVELP
jgi:hypothetical protein